MKRKQTKKNLTFFQPQNMPFFFVASFSHTQPQRNVRARKTPTANRIPRAPAINWAAAGVEIRGKPRNRQSRRARWEKRIGRESKCLVVVVVGRANFDQNYLLPSRCGEISIECKEWESNDLVGHARNFMLWYAVRAPRASFCFSVVSRGWQPRIICMTI